MKIGVMTVAVVEDGFDGGPASDPNGKPFAIGKVLGTAGNSIRFEGGANCVIVFFPAIFPSEEIAAVFNYYFFDFSADLLFSLGNNGSAAREFDS